MRSIIKYLAPLLASTTCSDVRKMNPAGEINGRREILNLCVCHMLYSNNFLRESPNGFECGTGLEARVSTRSSVFAERPIR